MEKIDIDDNTEYDALFECISESTEDQRAQVFCLIHCIDDNEFLVQLFLYAMSKKLDISYKTDEKVRMKVKQIKNNTFDYINEFCK